MSGTENAGGKTAPPRPARILIVDDNADIVAVTRRILARHGYETLTATDGGAGLEVARRERPDLVLLDVMLPGIDGLEVCRVLKGDPETRKLMIILVTGRGSPDNLVEGLESGADDYIAKPFQVAELVARVRSSLRIKSLTDEIEERNRQLLRSQRERLKAEKMATIGLLATGIAHEFNNIMSGISGFAQLAETNPAYKDRLVELARSQCARALEITRSLATYYRPTVELGSTSIVPEIENALCLITKRLKEKDIEVVRRYAEAPPVLARSGQLQEVFLNLLLNACQAVEMRGTITIGITAAGEMVEVTVEDDGRGIPREHQERIFDPFFTTRGALGGGDENGSGLGLTVSYNIVTSCGGGLGVESAPGAGSKFTVTLRAAPEEGPQELAARPSVERDRVVGPEERGCSVLIADPDDCVREMVEEYLRHSRVANCASWPEVHESLRAESFDLAIIDTDLGGRGGFIENFESALRERPDLRVLLTTSNSSGESFRAARSRADLHLLKPYTMESLANVLDFRLNEARRAREDIGERVP